MALSSSIKYVNDTGSDSSQKTCLVAQKVWYDGVQHRNRSFHYYALPLFFLQIIMFTFITRFLQLIFRPFKQPMIVSEMMAGIIIGPTMLASYDDFDSLIFSAQGRMLSDTLAWMGIIYYLFVEGLKQDIRTVTHAGKKQFSICVMGMLSSCLFTELFVQTTKAFVSDSIRTPGMLKFFPQAMAISNFAVIQPIIAELGLLNHELGRLSLSISVLNNALGLLIGLVNQSIRQGKNNLRYGLYTFFSTCGMYVFMLGVAWPATLRVVRRVPNGSRASPGLVFTFLMLGLLAGVISDLIGCSLYQAAWLLGIIIPPGPPLGSVLVEKIEAIMRYLLLPHFFLFNGRMSNLFDIPDWSTWWFMLLLTFFSCLGKFLGTTFSARYFEMPYHESATLALILCFKGIVELLIFNTWLQFQVIDGPKMATLEVATIFITVVITPLVRRRIKRYLTKPSFNYKGRTIEQSNPNNNEFRLMMCVHDEDNVPTLLNILNASINNASSSGKKTSPINLFVLHLVELLGRGVPVLAAHKRNQLFCRDGLSLHPTIFRAFEILTRRSGGLLIFNPFTSISPHKTMHQDVCALATAENVCLVIVPLHKQPNYGEGSVTGRASRLVARNILYEAPCSVGVLFDRNNMRSHIPKWTRRGNFSFRVGMVFLGGADDREALCYTSRMVENPGVSLLVLHCLAPYNCINHENERLLDQNLMGQFRLQTRQQDDVVYKEQTVANVEEMVNSIRSMGSNFDLMVVGRRHPAHSVFVDVLMGWNECVELGVIGDFFASSDFANPGASVLSIQQKINIS